MEIRDVLLSQNAACQGQCISLENGSECYNCFYTPPLVSQEEIVAAVDLEGTDLCRMFVIVSPHLTADARAFYDNQCVRAILLHYMLPVHDAERLMEFLLASLRQRFHSKALRACRCLIPISKHTSVYLYLESHAQYNKANSWVSNSRIRANINSTTGLFDAVHTTLMGASMAMAWPPAPQYSSK